MSLKFQYRDIFYLVTLPDHLCNMVLFEKTIHTLSFIHTFKSVRARVDGKKNHLPVQCFLICSKEINLCLLASTDVSKTRYGCSLMFCQFVYNFLLHCAVFVTNKLLIVVVIEINEFSVSSLCIQLKKFVSKWHFFNDTFLNNSNPAQHHCLVGDSNANFCRVRD